MHPMFYYIGETCIEDANLVQFFTTLSKMAIDLSKSSMEVKINIAIGGIRIETITKILG